MLSMIAGTFAVIVILRSTITLAGCTLLAEGGMRHYIVLTTAQIPDYHYLDDNEKTKNKNEETK